MHSKTRRIIALQVLVTFAVAGVLLATGGGAVAAVSALIGGAIGFIPAFIYAYQMTAAGGSDPRGLLRAQYKAELYKFATTVLLFALAFGLVKEMSALVLFLTYLATLSVYWVALVMP